MMELTGILESCREGDELAWEMLVRQYQGRIFAIAMSYVSDRDEARDLAQDIFVRVYRNLDSCRDAERFLP
jgi:RNA polymerase sigma-70 factor (ECF subfamily)